MFSTIGIVENVKVDNRRVKGGIVAAYDAAPHTILLRSDRG